MHMRANVRQRAFMREYRIGDSAVAIRRYRDDRSPFLRARRPRRTTASAGSIANVEQNNAIQILGDPPMRRTLLALIPMIASFGTACSDASTPTSPNRAVVTA